jgi:type II secretory pathway pseudopilin PulG
VVRQRGYTLVEVAVMMTVFGALLAIFFVLTAEMRKWEKRLPVNYMRHPQVASVMMRVRRDVLDASVAAGGPYPPKFGTFEQGPKVLIIDTILPNGTIQTVVWDFSENTVVRRHAYTNEMKTETWTARGLPPDFLSTTEISAVEFADRPFGVRITAKDSNGKTAIDQILQPRSHD